MSSTDTGSFVPSPAFELCCSGSALITGHEPSVAAAALSAPGFKGIGHVTLLLATDLGAF